MWMNVCMCARVCVRECATHTVRIRVCVGVRESVRVVGVCEELMSECLLV